MARPLLAGACLLAASCAVGADVVTVPVSGARTLIAVIGDRELIVVPIEDPTITSISIPDPPSSGTAIVAVHYACTTSALGLIPGRQQPAAEGRLLGEARAIYSAIYSGDPHPAWTEIDALPAIRVAGAGRGAARCDPPRVEHVALPGTTSEVVLAIASGDRSAVVRTEALRFFQVAAGAATPATAIDSSAIWLAGVRESASRVLLVGPGGELAVADPASGIEPRASMPGRFPARWIALAASPAPAGEVFALTDRGTFARFDGAAWTLLDDRDVELGAQLAVAWIDSGEAAGAGGEAPSIVRARELSISRDHPLNEPARVTALASIPGLGLVAGTDRGSFHAHSSGAWIALGESPLAGAIRAIAPVKEAVFLAADDRGAIARFDRAEGFCPAVEVFRATLGAHAILDDGAILAAGEPGSVDIARAAPELETITCPFDQR